MSDGNPLVLIVNHSAEVVLLLEQVVGDLGFESAVLANDSDWQTDGYSALLAYINERQPRGVLFDMPPPYDQSAQTVLRLIEESELAEGQWVVLSTSEQALQRIAAGSAAATLLKPFDLDELTALLDRAVNAAELLRASRSRTSPRPATEQFARAGVAGPAHPPAVTLRP